MMPNFKTTSRRPVGIEVYIVKDLLSSNSNEWNYQLLDQLFLNQEKEAIKKILVSMGMRPDKLIWHHDKRGQYSVRSGYKILKQSTRNEIQLPSTAANDETNLEV